MNTVDSRHTSLRVTCATALTGLLLSAVIAAPASAGSEPVVLRSLESASITQDGTSNRWTIANDGILMSVSIAPQGSLVVAELRQPGAEAGWDLSASADVTFVAGTRRFTAGTGDLLFRRAQTDEVEGAVRLALVFESPSAKVRATRTYACFPGAPAIETWTTFEPYQTNSAVTLSDIGIWQLTMAGTSINWVTGLRSGSSGDEGFTRKQAPLASGLTLGATGRATSTYMPLVWVDGPAGHLFAGLIWSGAWTITLTSPDASGRSTLQASLGSIATSMGPGVTIETPHGFYGVAGTAAGEVTRAIGSFMMTGVRHGRPFSPLVTYNTWYAYGVQIDEATLLAQMDRAAALGAELFVVDAGWYTGGSSLSDYTTGIGRWTADPARFPNGLRPLGDHAHALGMKFGIWMEPERVDMSTVNRTGLAHETWLATSGGRYDPGIKASPFAQICLSSAAARQWVFDQVSRVVSESGADYLKWDNNFWVNCNRSGHGHGALDGNLAHHAGLYDVLARLRARFPELVIENCAEGGNRLDPGMLQFTDAAWMDDVTSPSAHVRHNLQGLGAIFPPAYLLSFVKDDPAELVHNASDMPFYFRSRMPGILGLSLRGEEFGDDDTEAMAREIALYKSVRDRLTDATLLALTPQAGTAGNDGWDALEVLSASRGDAVVFAFATGTATDRITLRLQGLDPEAIYRVAVPGGRVLGTPTGLELMLDGIGVYRRSPSAANVLILTRLPAAAGSLQ